MFDLAALAFQANITRVFSMMMCREASNQTYGHIGLTPLMAAAGVGSRDSDTRGRYKTEKEAIGSIKLLADAGARINDADNRGQTPLHGAAFWGWNDLVQLLVDRGARPDAKDKRGMTPLDSAMGRAGGNGGFGPAAIVATAARHA